MNKDVVTLALNQIWSTPDSSNQCILQPARITPENGVMRSYTVKWDTIKTPDTTGLWHLYMVGGVHKSRLRLFGDDLPDTWVSFASAMNQSRTLINIYTQDGVELPRFDTFFMQTSDGNFLVAVRKNAKLAFDFNEAIWLRFYQNAYFSSEDAVSGAQLTTFGSKIAAANDLNLLQAQIDTIRGGAGYTGGLYLTINGYRASSLSGAVVGDVVEYVYDSSIYKVVDFQISKLPSFHSDRDGKKKLLLHYAMGWSGKIDFQANVDLYMIDAATQRGVYVHKNAQDMLRSVTYKDYAVCASYLSSFFDQFYDSNGNFTYDNMYLRALIRHDGIAQVPTEDANRQHYLLRLSDANQLNAMVGLDANVPVWNAATLEQSPYTQLLEAHMTEVTQDMAERALGYSVVNYNLCLNVVKAVVGSGPVHFPVPRACQAVFTAYEYVNGKLDNYRTVSAGGLVYYPQNSSTTLVEFIPSECGRQLDEVAGRTNFDVVSGLNYRFYMRKLVDGQVSSTWTDVTNDPTEHVISNGKARWITTGNRYRLARSDKIHLTYQTTLVSTDGVLQHTLSYLNADGTEVTLPVPLGELDLWINGYPAVEGVDYIYKFPVITVITKELLAQPVTGFQVLTIRMTGFCKSDLSSYKREEVGFVWDGLISVDGRYDPNYMKSTRVTVGGALVHQNDAPYVEDRSSGALSNGKPYAVREYINHLNNFISRDPRTYYDEAVAVDDSIADYLTRKMGEQDTGPVNPIEPRYKLYSPFICKVMYALKTGLIDNSLITGQYSDELVIQLVQPYVYLIEHDPIKYANRPDMRYCIIMPNWLDDYFCLDADPLKFLYNVVRIYADGLIDLSSSLYVCGIDPPGGGGGGIDLPPGGEVDLPPGG